MSNPITLSHAKKLRFLRRSAELKQSEVAEQIKISQQAYSKLENGETSFSDDVIDKISTFFNISPAEFEKFDHTVSIGDMGDNNNNNNVGYTVDLKLLLETLQKTFDTNKELYERLIVEKDKMISQLQKK